MNQDILQLQRDLLTLGFNPGPLDGLSGPTTRGAAHDAAQALKPEWDFTGKAIPDRLVALVGQLAQKRRGESPVGYPPHYYDLALLSAPSWRKSTRTWKSITGVTLHQTGCPMNETPERWFGLRAHYGVTYSGQIYRVHPERAFGWHAQSLSHKTVGIEIAGFFAGIEGDPRTRPGDNGKDWPLESVTPAQVESTKELVRYLVRLVSYHGGALNKIFAHRQATDDRTPDPGSKVWKEISLPLQSEIGLDDGGSGFTMGSGEPIPEAWDPRRDGIKY